MSKPLLVKSYYRSRPYDAAQTEKTEQLKREVYDREYADHLNIVLATTDFTGGEHVSR